MTQVEFEYQLHDLRSKRHAALLPIIQMQSEVKEEISAIDRQIKSLKAQREKMNQKRILISQQRTQVESEWGGQIAKLIQDNCAVTRELENISDWAIANELKKRGFFLVENSEFGNVGKSGDFLETFNAKLRESDQPDNQQEA